MSGYISAITTALIFFPFVALVFTLPYMFYCYRRWGSVLILRSVIIYSFILYLISVYFLCILPLPSIESVRQLTTARVQLIPFRFIADMFTDGLLPLFQELMNILMFIPFGLYLGYYFRCSLKKTLLFSFLLTLFLELTQLTGLYFIYPRSYRLFDIDDLIANTFGGYVGYLLVSICLKILPTREQLDTVSLKKGTEGASVIRRSVAFACDMIIIQMLSSSVRFLVPDAVSALVYPVVLVIYYGVIPGLLHGYTIGLALVKLSIASPALEDKLLFRCSLRAFCFYILYFFPIRFGAWLITLLKDDFDFAMEVRYAVLFVLIIAYFMLCLVSSLLLVLGKRLPYEKLSGTCLRSTISRY